MSASQNICRYFSATGNCFYGDQCNFLHIRPETTPAPTSTSSTNPAVAAKPKSQVPCKNIAMYGFCKFQGKGCEYLHDLKPEDIAAMQQSGVTSILKRPEKDLTSQFQNMTVTGEEDQFATKPKPFPQRTPGVGTTRGGTTYFYGSDPPPQQPQQPPVQLQYNPTASALPHSTIHPHHKSTNRRALSSFFMNEDLRQDFLRRNALIYTQVEDNRYKDLPQVVHRYHTLYPLDNPSRPTNATIFGYPSSVFKVFSSVDGLPYVLRKMEGFRLSNENALRMGELWRQIQHPNIVGLHEIFISKDFGDVNALFFAYNYHPGSETLEERYFGMLNQEYFVPEPVLWSYVCQIISALRAIHGAGLACKVIVPSKIILTGKNKIRVNGVGIQDVVNYDGNKNVAHYQHEDLIALGRLILSIACRTPNAVHNVVKSIEYLGSRYSIELKNFLVYLLKPNTISYPSVEDIVPMISGRLLMEIEHLNTYTDLLESDLSKELENGRLFRLLVKLGCINERPEFDMDPSWAETGDRYLLKLFRDYVFHQTYEDSTPVIDYAHMVECLNKLDAGVPEKIVLMSRDEQSLLIVSYKDLRRCTEEAFGELMMKARRHDNFQ